MNKSKIENALKFYMLATELKETVRSGWKVWNIEKERVESVAEHIYGTCILAIAIDSEFDLGVDLSKILLMLLIHELEEVKIGDLTPFDKVTQEEKRKIGKMAVEEVLSTLTKKDTYLAVIEEFEQMETKEALFAKMCDKLEADIQSKKYEEQGYLLVGKEENKVHLEDEKIKRLIERGAKTIADFFIENDRPIFQEKVFEEMADYVAENKLEEM